MFLALLCIATTVALRPAEEKPNIVLFFVDDMGYGDVEWTGHPTTKTPNLANLAYNGKILNSWYSGCPVCSGSRAALMTGRQFKRIGTPGVFSPTVNVGLPTNETTLGAQLKKIGYTTGAMGKWHLGQRHAYLPGNHGFDQYLGIPYSDDMGKARATPCKGGKERLVTKEEDGDWQSYVDAGYTLKTDEFKEDPAGNFLPLVRQSRDAHGNVTTQVLEQPLDFTTLAEKYNDYVVNFVNTNANDPFFLYMPFSHVHTTASNQPESQYSGCQFKNSTRRGMFGDALHEVDWIAGNVIDALKKNNLMQNTLIIFSSDNGPWMIKGKSGGSPGLFYGRTAGYWNVGKGSTWDGGIHEAAFVHWEGKIAPSRSADVVSSLDVFPTVSKIAGVPLPAGVTYDGRDRSDVWLGEGSEREILFFYGSSDDPDTFGPNAARVGPWKAHWRTGPGLGGCNNCKWIDYNDPPLLFNIDEDPSEAYPLTKKDTPPHDSDIKAVVQMLQAARAHEMKTFTFGKLVPAPDGPGEGPGRYGVCCDRSKGCDCDGPPSL